jgi:hypothetical protein
MYKNFRMNIYIVFTPLQLACHTGSIPLTIAAIDCIEKLISYKLIGSDAYDQQQQQQTIHKSTSNEATTSDNVANQESAIVNNTTNDINQAEKTEESNTATMEEQEIKVKKTIIDDIVTVICDAFIGENTDDKVTLQIIKVDLLQQSLINY